MGDSTFTLRKVDPSAALALLEAVRAADMPPDQDALHTRDLPLNLRRRFGLTDVVERQIERYAELRRERGKLPGEEIVRLFVLVSRRPDAEDVFVDAGRRLVVREVGPPRADRMVPRRLRERRALGRAARLIRPLSAHGRVQVRSKPPALVLEHGFPAQVANGSRGCSLVSSVLQTVLTRHGLSDLAVVHDNCEGDGHPSCTWQLKEVDL
jgi:hypothetical protein